MSPRGGGALTKTTMPTHGRLPEHLSLTRRCAPPSFDGYFADATGLVKSGRSCCLPPARFTRLPPGLAAGPPCTRSISRRCWTTSPRPGRPRAATTATAVSGPVEPAPRLSPGAARCRFPNATRPTAWLPKGCCRSCRDCAGSRSPRSTPDAPGSRVAVEIFGVDPRESAKRPGEVGLA